jgi:hypothetical protein
MPAPEVRQAKASQRRSMSKPEWLQIVRAHIFLRALPARPTMVVQFSQALDSNAQGGSLNFSRVW